MKTMRTTTTRRIYACRLVLATVTAAFAAAATLGPGVAQAEPASTLPSADQLTAQVSVIFDLNADRAQRASYLEAGDAALPVADTVAGPMAQHRSMVSMRVENPTLEGGHVNSQLVMSVMGIGAQRRPLDWIEQGGTWKLSTGSLCGIYTETSRTSNCPV
jgi:hypothetical protein